MVVRRPTEYRAVFTADPLFAIESTAGPIVVHVDDWWNYTPIKINTLHSPQRMTVRVEQLQRFGNRRYRFEGWSNGGAPTHTVDLPPAGGSLLARVIEEHVFDAAVDAYGSGGEAAQQAGVGPAAAPFALRLDRGSLLFVSTGGRDPAPQPVALETEGRLPAAVRIAADDPWLAAAPANLALSPRLASEAWIRAFAAGLDEGVYRSRLTVGVAGSAAGTAETVTIPVTLVVVRDRDDGESAPE